MKALIRAFDPCIMSHKYDHVHPVAMLVSIIFSIGNRKILVIFYWKMTHKHIYWMYWARLVAYNTWIESSYQGLQENLSYFVNRVDWKKLFVAKQLPARDFFDFQFSKSVSMVRLQHVLRYRNPYTYRKPLSYPSWWYHPIFVLTLL